MNGVAVTGETGDKPRANGSGRNSGASARSCNRRVGVITEPIDTEGEASAGAILALSFSGSKSGARAAGECASCSARIALDGSGIVLSNGTLTSSLCFGSSDDGTVTMSSSKPAGGRAGADNAAALAGNSVTSAGGDAPGSGAVGEFVSRGHSLLNADN